MKGRMDVISEVYESQMQINWYHDSSRTVLQQLNVIEGFLIMLSLNNFAFDFHEYILILNKSIKQKKQKQKKKTKTKTKKQKQFNNHQALELKEVKFTKGVKEQTRKIIDDRKH